MVKKTQQLNSIKISIQHNNKYVKLYTQKTKKKILLKNFACYTQNKNISLLLIKNKSILKKIFINDL